MRRKKFKPDYVIWEGVRVEHGKTIEECKQICERPELVTTPASHIVVTANYVFVRHPDSNSIGDWTILPTSLVKKIVRRDDD